MVFEVYEFIVAGERKGYFQLAPVLGQAILEHADIFGDIVCTCVSRYPVIFI